MAIITPKSVQGSPKNEDFFFKVFVLAILLLKVTIKMGRFSYQHVHRIIDHDQSLIRKF